MFYRPLRCICTVRAVRKAGTAGRKPDSSPAPELKGSKVNAITRLHVGDPMIRIVTSGETGYLCGRVEALLEKAGADKTRIL